MRIRPCLLAPTAALALQPAFGADAPAWGDDLDAALAEARESGRMVLVDFTGSDWCGYCIKLNNEVLSGDA